MSEPQIPSASGHFTQVPSNIPFLHHIVLLGTCLMQFVSADLRLAGGAEGWDQNLWRVTVDGVMGGLSTGSFRIDGGTMVFTGDINLNGGGFSSVRKTLGMIDLSTYEGIVVELEAQTYTPGEAPLGLQLRLDDATSRYGFASAFARPLAKTSGQLAKVFLPLASFDRGSRSGYTCRSCRLDTRSVNGLAVYVLFQSGPFEVRLRSITAVKKSESPPVPSISLASSEAVTGLLTVTIKSGGSLYDKDYEELCIAIYSTSLHAIMAATGPSVATKSVACAGLINARKSSKSENAWILRHAIDAILSDIQGTPRSVQHDWLPSAQSASGTFDSCAEKLENLPQRNVPMKSAAPSAPGTNLITGFVGPFEMMGISGYNDLESSKVEDPSECATKCLNDPLCRSFDYGAREQVKGECWLSTANRDSIGSAYSSWPLYDYYERRQEEDQDQSVQVGSNPASQGSDPLTASKARSLNFLLVGVLIKIGIEQV